MTPSAETRLRVTHWMVLLALAASATGMLWGIGRQTWAQGLYLLALGLAVLSLTCYALALKTWRLAAGERMTEVFPTTGAMTASAPRRGREEQKVSEQSELKFHEAAIEELRVHDAVVRKLAHRQEDLWIIGVLVAAAMDDSERARAELAELAALLTRTDEVTQRLAQLASELRGESE